MRSDISACSNSAIEPRIWKNLYYVLVFTVAARWAGGHLGRKLPAALRAGLVLVAAGSAGLVIATLALVVSVLIRWSGHRPPTWIDIVGLTLLAAGLLIVIVGLILPSALRGPAALRLRRRRRRVYRELEPLWAQLTEAFPQLPPSAVLDERPDHGPDAEGGPNQRGAGRRDLPTLPTVGLTRRYYPRIIECRDCLVQLSPYLDLVTDGHLDPTGLPTGADLAAALAARIDPDRPVESVIGPVHSGDASRTFQPDAEQHEPHSHPAA